ncbi:proteasome assembly chaperone family protein [Halomarina ordinaria]|uniref:Proteasome assembly chaperone family protein n=1 Tax=Halomarina ordinaria TaxID=3033939 RepID=A0ABD5UDF9_9EURY|nr:proteasome assembly chaperone family protein [Halomarina sp. PSRA2]
MDEVHTEVLAEPALEDPVLIEGLPGVGHVGKLAAEHLLEEFDTTLVARLYSRHFPPQVTVEDGRSQLVGVEFHAVETGDADLLVLTGDHQAQSNEGHYLITDAVLDVAEEFGVDRAYALGGVPTGELVDEYGVIAAASDDALIETLDPHVEFREDEPAGGIVGVSGLLLGLGERRDLPVACLMGETSGYLVDPKSARAVLEVLQDIVGFDVGYDSLEERAEEMEEVAKKIREMEQAQQAPSDEDLRYIG